MKLLILLKVFSLHSHLFNCVGNTGKIKKQYEESL